MEAPDDRAGRNGGPWKGLDDLEIATCRWVSWFNTERLHGALGDRTPAEIEDRYREDLSPPRPERTNPASLHQTQAGSIGYTMTLARPHNHLLRPG